MANYGAKILNNSVRALSVQQAVIANTSNNISNVNTAGYSRRVVNLENASSTNTGSGINIGNGVDVQGIQRMADDYINKLLQASGGKQASSELQDSFQSRIQSLFGLSGDNSTISTNLNDFYTSLNDLTSDPSSLQARSSVIDKAQTLVTTIKSTYDTLASLQTEADDRISTEMTSVNSLLTQIADANKNITATEGAGQTASDDRDRRDTLLQTLATKISYNSVENTDGSINVYLSNGFTLVSGGTSHALTVTKNPSFASNPPPSLSGGVLSSITYDYSNGAGTADFDLTQVLKAGDGSVGALLKLRGYNDPANTNAFQADGPIVATASRVEGIAQDLLSRFNTTYLGTDEDTTTAGFQSNALNLYGNAPATFGLFDFSYSGTVKDKNANGLPDQADLTSLQNSSTASSPKVTSFATLLKLTSSDPKAFAAARDQNPVSGSTTLVTGDGQNVKALSDLRTATTNISVGNFSLNGVTLEDAYNETVSYVSTQKSSISSQAALDKSNLTTVQSKRDEVSAVSLDEEFTGLISSQKAYQASAKMIKVADDLLTTIIQLI